VRNIVFRLKLSQYLAQWLGIREWNCGVSGTKTFRSIVNYSETEGSYERTDRFRLTSVEMEKLLSMCGLFLSPDNQIMSRCQWEAVATDSTAFARYRRNIMLCVTYMLCLMPQNLYDIHDAVCTVLDSWWWMERPSETFTSLSQNKINVSYCASVCFYRKIFRGSHLPTHCITYQCPLSLVWPLGVAKALLRPILVTGQARSLSSNSHIYFVLWGHLKMTWNRTHFSCFTFCSRASLFAVALLPVLASITRLVTLVVEKANGDKSSKRFR
jgi:hypothetical protein